MNGMDAFGFFYEYFIRPIDEHSGYNPVNTIAYALVALLAAYAIYLLLKRAKIRIDENFAYSLPPFVLLGSAMRVAADALDPVFPATAAWSAAHSPLLSFVASSGINLYALLASPGVYLVVGPLTVASVLAFNHLRRQRLIPYFGLALSALPLAAILPLATNFTPFAAILLLALFGAAAGASIARHLGQWLALPGKLLSRGKGGKQAAAAPAAVGVLGASAIFAHALDGAATFTSINLFGMLGGVVHSPFGYGEQHVLSNAIGAVFGGFWAFYAVKVLFAAAVVYWLGKSSDVSEEERVYVLLLVIIFGLAPGIRDALRMLCGV